MKHLSYLVLFTAFLLASCTTSDLENLDDVQGTWKLTSTSGGSQGSGYTAQFDEMIINSDLNFELLMEDTIVASGSLEEKSSDIDDIFVNFSGESDLPNLYDIIEDGEKYITFEGTNIMHLRAPCCDRYNSHWEKN